MKIFSYLLLLGFGVLSAQPNFNMDLISNVEIGEAVNDVWGYVDEQGVEYAIIGSQTNTTIFSLADPANPIEVGKIPGTSSTWRDIKSWNDHLYVVADSGNDGLLIIDMSSAPDSISHVFWQPILTVNADVNQLTRCHNIYIDENGFAYLAGCRVMNSRDDRGAIILDLNQDPKVPVHVGSETREYAHDLFTRDNIMYASEIYRGEISMYDVTDKADPVFIASAQTSSNFTHNAWISDDGNYVFTTDERGNAYVDAFDISDPTDIKFLDKFRPLETENKGVIPHNTHYLNGFLVTSWYTDGVVLTDATRPENMIKIGSFDTYLGGDGGFSGCWGAYPFLPSGIVLASDRQTGLYVLNPTYTRACYLEGTITREDNGDAINAAEISITAEQANQGISNALGTYKTGLAESGTYTVTVSHPDYFSQEVEAILINGEITILDVQLKAVQEITVEVRVVEAGSQNMIANAQLKFFNVDRISNSSTDSMGVAQAILTNEEYNVIAGAWGYRQRGDIVFNPDVDNLLTIELEKGYEDDFVLDLGWEVSGDAVTGQWTRDIPIGTTDPDDGNIIANVDMDDPDDLGEECYITGNLGGTAADDDVDDGVTILTSPPIFIDGATEIPILQYRIWFYMGGGTGFLNDTLNVIVTDGTNSYIIDSYDERTNGWTDVQEIILDSLMLDYSKGFQVQIEVGDDEEFGNFVEAGFDVFRVALIIDEDSDGFNSDEDCDDTNAAINPDAIEIPNNDVDEDCDGVALVIDDDNDGFNSDEDCDDTDAAINPDAIEIPNNDVDEDCDGVALVIDDDNDGFNSDEDCDDTDAAINPAAMEIPNNDVDEDCDGVALVIDEDNDGFNSDEDCDDTDAAINPEAIEIPNNDVDEDCDGVALVIDDDNDGFNSDEDCDDTDAAINPDAIEIPNNDVDEDCDGVALVIDEDNDGFNSDEDCDDTDPAINPDAIEIPNNGIDEDCDGMDSTTAIHEIDGTVFSIYPNPVVNSLYIELSVQKNLIIEMFDINGKLMKSIHSNNERTDIPVRNLSAGLYILSIRSNESEIRVIEPIIIMR